MKTKFVFALALSFMCTVSLSAQGNVASNGIKYSTIKPGSGEKPEKGKEFYFHIAVKTTAGNQLFSTQAMNVPVHGIVGESQEPEIVAVQDVLVNLNEGGKYRLEVPKKFMPEDMANNLEDDIVIYEIDLLDVGDAKPSGAKEVKSAASSGGADAARKKFNSIKSDDSYNFAEWDMNSAGYDMLQNGKTDEAIEIFKMNTELNPRSWNAYDSLGDGYVAKGDKENAKASYEKALELNPDYTGTKEKLDKL